MLDKQARSILLELVKFSSSRKGQLFVVGGCLRDLLQRKNISDIDLTGKNAAELGAEFAQSLNLSFVPLDKTPGRSTTRIILSQEQHFDLTDMQGTKIEEDLLKRDFTINAMGQELSDFLSSRKTIIDLHKGNEDLENEIIRATSNSVFEEDPLRMLRAFRFAATMNFSIEKGTLKAISLYKKQISKTAGERIWQELACFFEADSTGELMGLMKETGLLSCLFPASFPNWEETLLHYKRLEHILSNPKKYFPEQDLNLSKNSLLKLSILLKELDPNASMESKSRKDYGTPKTYEVLKNLKASNNDIVFICKSIQSLHFLSRSLSCTDSSLYDLCLKCGDQLVAGVLLQVCTLSFPDDPEKIEKNSLHFFAKILEFYFMRYLPVLGEKAIFNGNDLIKRFNISPSPVVGNVLENIQRAQILGEIKTPAEAEALAAKILKSQEQN